MISTVNVGLQYGGRELFKNVDMTFTKGNCYGLIGANGAGKSTFLKILSGEIEPNKGEVVYTPGERLSVLKQDHFEFDEYTVIRTVLMGNAELCKVMDEREELYSKSELTEEEGIRVCEIEDEFAEMGGYSAESDAEILLNGLGITNEFHYMQMSELAGEMKVKVLLAQALFGNPQILLMDEPTNHLDIDAIRWLEEFLIDLDSTVIVVSHDRHFLNKVCTHIVDIDFGKITMYVGNYDFWYESSQLMQRMMRDQNRKAEEKIKELQNFIQRFSANKSKSRQATSRKKLLDKITVEEMPASSRRYPYVGFTMDRELGKDVLTVSGLTKTVDGVKVLDNVTFTVGRTDKIAFTASNEFAVPTLFKILMGELEPDAGTFKWGVSTSQSYFPQDNSAYFTDTEDSIIRWLEQYSKDTTETYLRGFLGKMLFSGEDVYKPVQVLSGGEKVRCMLSRMMMFGSNVLLLDQPTNHLDLESITAVNNGLIDFKGVVLFASHDHEFTQTVANRIIEILPEGGTFDRVTTYDEYLEMRG